MIGTQPLAEVFGNPIDNQENEADRNRKLHFCPFNNRIPNCSKDRANDPLGICSVFNQGKPTIICPIRFRERWLIIEDAARIFFEDNASWSTIIDMKMYDRFNTYIDVVEFVLVSFDSKGTIVDFLPLDTQAAFVNRNIRKSFNAYIANQEKYLMKEHKMDCFVDYVSTIHQKIAPQLIYRGSIFHNWGKKIALVIDEGLSKSLPRFTEVERENAEIIWLVYALVLNGETNKFELTLKKIIYTLFEPTVFEITKVEAGHLEDFVAELQSRLDDHLDKGYPPEAPTLMDFLTRN